MTLSTTSNTTYITQTNISNNWGSVATTNATGTRIGNNYTLYSLYDYHAHYSWSKSGKTCVHFTEPCYRPAGLTNDFFTKKDAWEYLDLQLIDHVNFLIKKAKKISENTALEKRLIKYNNSKGLDGLKRFQYLISLIPEIK